MKFRFTGSKEYGYGAAVVGTTEQVSVNKTKDGWVGTWTQFWGCVGGCVDTDAYPTRQQAAEVAVAAQRQYERDREVWDGVVGRFLSKAGPYRRVA